MSKNNISDVLLQRTLSRLLNVSQTLYVTKVNITINKVPYVLYLPVKQTEAMKVQIFSNDKGNLKIKASLNKNIKNLIDAELRNARNEMISYNDSIADYSGVANKRWKQVLREVGIDLRKRILRSLLSSYKWTA